MSQTFSLKRSASKQHMALDVELHQVSKFFDGEPAVRDVNLDIHQGDFFSILGPSGCGKTTTLRLIAGFESLSTGDLRIQGQSMSRVPSYRRPVNTVFQSYALFNHLNVWDNIAFGLRIKRFSKLQIQERVSEALRLVKMEAFARRFPIQLSGGQQQRVALARALVNRPAVMLLDEPLGALDLKLRKEMQIELSNLHRQLGITFIMVTHDQEEALSLSERIAVMRDGQIEQIGSPSEIYERPKTPFVADFIGDTNLIEGRVDKVDASMLQVTTARGLKMLVKLPDGEVLSPSSRAVVVSVRPEQIHLGLTAASETSINNCFEGRLKHIMYLGAHVHCRVELLTGDFLTVLQPNRSKPLPNSDTPVYASWAPTDCLALAA